MKPLNIIITTLAIAMVLLASCSTKHLSTKRSRNTVQQAEKTSIHSTQNETLNGSRIISFSDSARHLYHVTIFPLDTFSFSMKDGFKGKASRIEVTGTEEQVRQISDSTAIAVRKKEEAVYDKEIKLRTNSASNSKILEKQKNIGMGIVLVVIVVLLVWAYWGFRRK